MPSAKLNWVNIEPNFMKSLLCVVRNPRSSEYFVTEGVLFSVPYLSLPSFVMN